MGWGWKWLFGVAVDAEAFGSAVGGQVVAALGAVGVGDLDTAMAGAADGSHLELALGAEVEGGVYGRGAVGAAGEDRLAEHEVDDRADAAGEHYADQHPEAGGHAAAFDVLAYVTEQQRVAGPERAPGVAHHQAEGQELMLVVRHDNVEDVLHAHEEARGQNHRPDWNHAQFVIACGVGVGLPGRPPLRHWRTSPLPLLCSRLYQARPSRTMVSGRDHIISRRS